MNEPEVHTLTGAYAADALDADRAGRLRGAPGRVPGVPGRGRRAHRRPPPGSPQPPPSRRPPQLRSRVLAEVAQTRQLSPLPAVSGVDELGERRDRRRWYQPAGRGRRGAAAGRRGRPGRRRSSTRTARRERAEQRARPDRRHRHRPGPGRGHGPRRPRAAPAPCVAADDTALFRASDLPELPDDQAYQLWRSSATGRLSRSASSAAAARLEALVDRHAARRRPRADVEPAAGSTTPTGELVLRVPDGLSRPHRHGDATAGDRGRPVRARGSGASGTSRAAGPRRSASTQ